MYLEPSHVSLKLSSRLAKTTTIAARTAFSASIMESINWQRC